MIITSHIKVIPPEECIVKEFYTFIDMVKAGGQNLNEGLVSRVKKAKYLGFYYLEEKLISISAIKTPTDSYIEYIFSNAGLDIPDNILEKGWTYTLPDYRKRGYGLELGLKLIQKVDTDLFATIRRNNGNIPRLLTRQGFKQEGKPFNGQAGFEVLLFRRKYEKS